MPRPKTVEKAERLLAEMKAAVEREGSISAFAASHCLGRTVLNNILNGKRPVSRPLVEALGLRWVYTPQ